MPTITEQARHIYDEWNAGFDTRDLDRVMALYAEDATIETPAVLANYPDAPAGILVGRELIRGLFAKNIAALSTTFQGLYRPVQFFLRWQNILSLGISAGHAHRRPGLTLFESMDIKDGLIVVLSPCLLGLVRIPEARQAVGRSEVWVNVSKKCHASTTRCRISVSQAFIIMRLTA